MKRNPVCKYIYGIGENIYPYIPYLFPLFIREFIIKFPCNAAAPEGGKEKPYIHTYIHMTGKAAERNG